MRSRVLAAVIATLTLTASVFAAQTARPQHAQAATGPTNVAYVFDFGSGVNDTQGPNPTAPGSSIFTNAAAGSAPGSGNTAAGIDLGGTAKLILNEQTPVPGADKGLTVNALHLQVLGQAVDVVASATSDAHNC